MANTAEKEAYWTSNIPQDLMDAMTKSVFTLTHCERTVDSAVLDMHELNEVGGIDKKRALRVPLPDIRIGDEKGAARISAELTDEVERANVLLHGPASTGYGPHMPGTPGYDFTPAGVYWS